MTSVVRFQPALGDWVAQNLALGESPRALIEVMHEKNMALDAAKAIVDAFSRARMRGTPPPVDVVELPEPPRLPARTSFSVDGRIVRVAARAQSPVLAVLNNVLDAEECAELIKLARPRLKPSTVVDPVTGQDIAADWRASQGMFFRPAENAFIARLDRRLSALMNLPEENGEGLQVLYYPQGAGSAPHFDFLVPSNEANRASIARSGQRVSTLVSYLNDVPEGGETSFPATGWAVSPQRGNAVYFEYSGVDDERIDRDSDHASLHASNAVIRGEKWVATKWMRSRKFVSA